jgi:type VI secretion system secreted protein VgrG
MPRQSDLRFTFAVLGGEAAPAFEVIEFDLEEGLSETFLLDLKLSSTDPLIDLAQFTLWHGQQQVEIELRVSHPTQRFYVT